VSKVFAFALIEVPKLVPVALAFTCSVSIQCTARRQLLKVRKCIQFEPKFGLQYLLYNFYIVFASKLTCRMLFIIIFQFRLQSYFFLVSKNIF